MSTLFSTPTHFQHPPKVSTPLLQFYPPFHCFICNVKVTMTEIVCWRAKSHGMAECKGNGTEPWYHTYISWWVSVNTNWAAHDKATGSIGVQRGYNTGCPTNEIPYIKIWEHLTPLDLRCHVCNGNKWWKPLLLIVDGAVTDYEFLIIVIRIVWQESFVAVDKQHWLKVHPHSTQKIWHIAIRTVQRSLAFMR